MSFLRREDAVVNYQPPRMTNGQMRALEKFIDCSTDATYFAKEVIIWALRQSDNLTKPVALSVQNNVFGTKIAKEIQEGAHNMLSSNCNTQLGFFFIGMGTETYLSHGSGCFTDNGGFDPNCDGVTIWISFILYDKEAELLLTPPTLEELDVIEAELELP